MRDEEKYKSLLGREGDYTPPYMVFDHSHSLVVMTENVETGHIFPVPFLVRKESLRWDGYDYPARDWCGCLDN